MTYLPPARPIEDEPASTKASPESVLAAPRLPVTRWNRRYLLLGAGAVATLVGAGFYIGFGGAAAGQRRPPPAPVADTAPSTRSFAGRYAAGYGDPAVKSGPPGTASLPPPGQDPADAGGSAAAAPAARVKPVDPAVQQAREQITAARAAGPFFAVQAQPDTPSSPPEAGSLASAVSAPASTATEADLTSLQGRKQRFMAASRLDDYVAAPLRAPASPWEVKAGAVIPAALLTALDSDLPGEVIAQVTEPVYDHATGRTVLIPQGSRLIGQYDSQVAYGQSRALIAWNRIIMPDGRSLNIGSMTGADLTGAAGLRDRVDEHFWQLARGILLSTVLSVGAASSQDASARSSGSLVLNSAASGVAGGAQQAGQQITERDLGRQPTIRVRAGWPVRVLVNKDMILAPYS